ncbi:MAG TPA: amidophosphoribosyltransferase [Clostridiales bacterium]|nr:amidophosphoribosyltransferase [Clostridiales bacterium]HQD72387.1 amidophosphoribosyltransferase [Clostridiales bacterium]
MNKSKYSLGEECAVFGFFNRGEKDVGQLAYQSLFSMQHRGQDGAGLAGAVGNEVRHHKNIGLVNEVFTKQILDEYANDEILIGHVRYATSSSVTVLDTQPLVMHGYEGFIAMAHNGHIVNGNEIRRELQKNGVLFQTNVDSEALMHIIAGNRDGIEEGIKDLIKRVRGSYALTLMCPGKLIGVRDPWGIRPLCLGRLGDSYVLASESCAFNAIGAVFVRDIKPGEIVIITSSGISSIETPPMERTALCVFEYVYFARNDSVIDGVNVYQSRIRMGRHLCKTAPVEADIVSGVPESAIPAAIGYANESGITYGQCLIKNAYSGRTFIQEGQMNREQSVRMKLCAIHENVENKRIVLVDDSIVRGTNSMYIVKMLRNAGAKEIHMRIASPPVKFACRFGIDTPSRKNLVGAYLDTEEIASRIGADSLAYLGIEDLIAAVGNKNLGLCSACFDGKYPMPID